MTKISNIIVFTFVVAQLFCCKPPRETKGTQATAGDTIKEKIAGKATLDTLKVVGKAVVFFTISQNEYDSLTQKGFELDELLDDFNFYAGEATDSIKKKGFQTIMTANRFIKIEFLDGRKIVLDRLSDDSNFVGCIFSDGVKEPSIEYGVATNLDIISKLDRFAKQ
ncbi:MAG: hypothetical protein JSU09_14950 [Bacteroidetes bacterium]|nr:hypothetical protein [Bacteroidota bacterium]